AADGPPARHDRGGRGRRDAAGDRAGPAGDGADVPGQAVDAGEPVPAAAGRPHRGEEGAGPVSRRDRPAQGPAAVTRDPLKASVGREVRTERRPDRSSLPASHRARTALPNCAGGTTPHPVSDRRSATASFSNFRLSAAWPVSCTWAM